MQRFSHGTTAQRAPTAYISGTAWMEDIAAPPPPSRLRVLHVHFLPGARTAWHNHPYGQLLQVTHGAGLVQRRDRPIEEIRMGDFIWFRPNEWHWHGAGPTTLMSHIATQEVDPDGTAATWGDTVSDEDYSGFLPNQM